MKVMTFTEGELKLSYDDASPADLRLFRLMKVGLGSLGIVTELTLRCVPEHYVLEEVGVHRYSVPSQATVDHGANNAGGKPNDSVICKPAVSVNNKNCCDVMSVTEDHYTRIGNFKHMKYMSLPYTGVVISTMVNPLSETAFNKFQSQRRVYSKPNTNGLIKLLQEVPEGYLHYNPTHVQPDDVSSSLSATQ